MTIKQKKASNTTTFVFHDDELRYTIKEPAGTASFRVDYEAIPEECTEFEERRVWFRHAGVLWVIIGFAQIYFQISDHGSVGIPFWLLIGLGCLGYYWFSATKFSIFESARGRIFIIKDKKEERIKTELRTRRNNQIKQRYAKIIDASDPNQEASRLNWLLKNNIISEDEFNSLMVDLRLGITDKQI